MLLIVLILIYVILLHIQLILLLLGLKQRDKLIKNQEQLLTMQDAIIDSKYRLFINDVNLIKKT